MKNYNPFLKIKDVPLNLWLNTKFYYGDGFDKSVEVLRYGWRPTINGGLVNGFYMEVPIQAGSIIQGSPFMGKQGKDLVRSRQMGQVDRKQLCPPLL